MQQRSGALACITNARSQEKYTIWACASGCAPPEGKRIKEEEEEERIINIITIKLILMVMLKIYEICEGINSIRNIHKYYEGQ